jgi:hypothetical protein
MVGRSNSSANEIIHPDNGCAKAKAAGYFGKCIDCPFEQCFEDGGRVYAPRDVKTQRKKLSPTSVTISGATYRPVMPKSGGLNSRE